MSENNFNSEQNRNTEQTRVDGGNGFNFETEVVTNESGKKAIKVSKLSKKQKDALMSSGVAFAGLAAGAGVFSMLSFTDEPTMDAAENAEVTVSADESVVIELEAPVSSAVSESMSFNQAFAAAREELGPGGLFVFEGDLYHTYTASEWNNMSEADRMEFSSSISVQGANDAPAATTSTSNAQNAEEVAVAEEPANNQETADNGGDLDIIGYDLDNDGIADIYVFDLDENQIPDILIDSNGDGVFDQVVMNVDFESDAPLESYETFDVEIYPEDLADVEVVTIDRESAGAQADNSMSSVSAQDDLIFDELADNDMDMNFDNESDVSDFIG